MNIFKSSSKPGHNYTFNYFIFSRGRSDQRQIMRSTLYVWYWLKMTDKWILGQFAGCRIKDNVINLYKFTGKFRQMWEAICSISWTFKWRYLPPTARSLQPLRGYFTSQFKMEWKCVTQEGGVHTPQPLTSTPFCNQCQSHCLTNPLSSSS